MATISILDGLSQEETLITLLSNLTDAINKLSANSPRTDLNKRIVVNASEVSQSISTVTTLNTLNTVGATNITTGTVKVLDTMPVHLSNSGAIHIYDNIKFT